jgi:hypothetical protein
MFTASILNVEDGSLLVGGYRNYRTMTDGIQLMAELAELLTGGKTATAPVPTEEPPQEPAKSKKTKESSPEANAAARLKTIGISVGSSLIDPLVIVTVRGSFAPARNFYIELGADWGLISAFDDVDQYWSLYPFAHLGFFVPFAGKGGWYAGMGAGYMIGEYTFSGGGTAAVSVPAVDLTTGFIIGNLIDISYTLRTNFDSASNKISVGFVHRFK